MSATKSDHIETMGDFQRYLEVLATKAGSSYDSPLEQYLRSLWGLVRQEQNALVTWALLAKLITEAFHSEPFPFDENWLIDYVSPPQLEEPQLTEHGYEQLQQMILYQIADLHRMADNGSLYNPDRYFGIDSPTKHRWYNFDPGGFLKCAASAGDPSAQETDCTWGDLAIILWLGQIYE